MRAALATEWLKFRRSPLPWMTAVACTIGVAVAALFMFIGSDPQRARALGIIGAKAQLAGLDPTWRGYLGLLSSVAAIGGVLIFGMTMVWIFGREFADHTAKDLLALPTSRTSIVAAKLLVATAWALTLTAYLCLGGIAAGAALALPGWNGVNVAEGILRIIVTAATTIALTATFAYASSRGRGYLPGVLALFAVLFTAQVVAALGYGHWYPYAIPAIYAGMAGPDQPPAGVVGFTGVAVIAIVFVTLTVRRWNHTDHTR
jgi:ABC-2 type transport system permease protein